MAAAAGLESTQAASALQLPLAASPHQLLWLSFLLMLLLSLLLLWLPLLLRLLLLPLGVLPCPICIVLVLLFALC